MDEQALEKYLIAKAPAGANPEDWAYKPDLKSPSTWRLDISDAHHVGGAMAALGPGGFRGQQVDIPAQDRGKVKAAVLRAWRKFNPDKKEVPEVLKGVTMTIEDLTAKVGEMETLLADATKRADAAEAVLKLSAEDRNIYDALPVEKQVEFLAADTETRKGFKPVEKKEDDNEAVTKAVSKAMETANSKIAELSKAVETANARVTAAETLAKAESDARQKVEFQKRAETEFPNLPGDVEKKGSALRAVATKLSKEESDSVLELLKAGNEALAQLGTPTGREVPSGGGDAWGKIETMAKSLVAATPKMSMAKAITQVTMEHPELYEEYLRSQPKQ